MPRSGALALLAGLAALASCSTAAKSRSAEGSAASPAAGSGLATSPSPTSPSPTSPSPTSDARPNVVLILADDLGFECLGVNGGESYQTPCLDRMAAEGVRFTRCHSTPLCTPSRVQLMTGRY